MGERGVGLRRRARYEQNTQHNRQQRYDPDIGSHERLLGLSRGRHQKLSRVSRLIDRAPKLSMPPRIARSFPAFARFVGLMLRPFALRSKFSMLNTFSA